MGVKLKSSFVHCVPVQSTHYNIGDNQCDRCKSRDKKKCYHHDVCDSVTLPQLLSNLEEELGNYCSEHGKCYASVREKSKLHTEGK